MKEIIITNQEENQRLDKYLMKYMNQAPRGFLYKMLRKKRIKLNGGRAQGNELLKEGDTLQLYLSEDTLSGFMEEKTIFPAKRHFGIVYEDNHVLIACKPAGLLSQPEASSDRDTFLDQVLYYLYETEQYAPGKESVFTPGLCNRLDRNTGGLIAVGKSLLGAQEMSKAIAGKTLDKYYLTLVFGRIRQKGVLEGYHRKEEDRNQVVILPEADGQGKKVITEYEPVEVFADSTLLRVKLVTGKSHQIRAHFQAMGHPVAGDRKYGDPKANKYWKETYGLTNQFLFAYQMVWNVRQSPLDYLAKQNLQAPLPALFQKLINGERERNKAFGR